MKPIITILIVVCFLLGIHTASVCQNPEEIYQKALVKEEGEGKLQEAIDLFNQVAYSPKSENALQAKAKLHLGMCYEKLGMEKARGVYNDVINNYPHQETEVAVARERVMKLNEHLVDIKQEMKEHIDAGNKLLGNWEYEKAIQEFEKAIELDPEALLALNARFYIGQSQYRDGNFKEALSIFTKLVEENPESVIAPVSELMITQVKQSIENNSEKINEAILNESELVDSETGITFRKVRSFSGKNDIISHTGGFNLSPDARFVVLENKVVPLDGSSPFNLINREGVLRAVYAPGMKRAAFYADSAIWVAPVSPGTGRVTGKPKRLLDGNYRFQGVVNWHPEGENMAFVRTDDSIFADIWIMSAINGKLVPFTDGIGFEHNPAWSPDGQSIAFRKDGDIWIKSISGGKSEMLVNNGGSPRWSPDGQHIFHSKWDNRHICSIENKTNVKFNIPPQIGRFMGFSEKKDKLLFFRSSFNIDWGLKVVSVKGGPSFKPASDNIVFGSQWLSDSKQILIEGGDDSNDVHLKVVSLNDNKTIDISIDVDLPGEPSPFVFSPDLTKLTFTVKKESGNKDIYIVPFDREKAKAEGEALLVFEEWSGGAYNVTFNWSQDGQNIALIHNDDIWVVKTDGSKKKQITSTLEKERWVRWSPDGKKISYVIPDKQAPSLFLVSADGKNCRRIHSQCKYYNWSMEDNNLLIVGMNSIEIFSGEGQFIRDAVLLSDLHLTNLSDPSFSPDGKNLAFIGYSDDDSMIYLYSIDKDSFTHLANDEVNDYKYNLRWSPDGKWLSYLTCETLKARPEGILWETGYDELIEKLFSEKNN